MQQAGMSWKVMAGLALAVLALLWFWAPSALPIALGLVLVVLIFQWRALAAVQVYFEQAQPAEPAFPRGYEAEFVESARELTRQGFVPLGRFVQRMQPGQDDWGETHWFASASGDTLVVLQPPAELERADHLLKSVITSGADGRLLGSGTVSPVMRMFELPEFPTHILPPAPMAQVLRAHRQWLNLLHVQPVPLATDPEGLTPDTAMALVHAHLQRQFRLLQAKGRVTPDAQGGWRLRGRFYGQVLGLARAAARPVTPPAVDAVAAPPTTGSAGAGDASDASDSAMAATASPSPQAHGTPATTSATLAHGAAQDAAAPASPTQPASARPASEQALPRQLALMPLAERQGRYSPTPGMQLLMLIVSVLVFTALGAWFWSAEFAVTIAAVVLVHELGHWAAMRAFGWRNVQLVLLPLLGGVATGVEQRASARQRVWVTLAGPLPGIVLAFAALYGLGPTLMHDFVDSGEASWPMLAISVTLLLNYLNLLPFPPLDGGQLLRNLWPQRWRGGEWLLLAVLLTAGLAVSMWQSWWFIVFLIAMQWPSVRRSREDAQLLATLPLDAAQRPTPELDLLILTALQARLPAQSLKERLTRALSLRQTVRMQPLGLSEGLLVLAVWLGLWAWAAWLAWQTLHWVGIGGPLID